MPSYNLKCITICDQNCELNHGLLYSGYSLGYVSSLLQDKLIPDISFVSSRIINFKHVLILTTLLILVVIEICRCSACTYKNAMYHAFRRATTILKSMNQCLQKISIFFSIFFLNPMTFCNSCKVLRKSFCIIINHLLQGT